MDSFRFKQFTIVQERAAMRVNTDGVLLGAWMSLPEFLPREKSGLLGKQSASMGEGPISIGKDDPFTLLDIGTGTGVIALMAAQRLETRMPTIGVGEERQPCLAEIDAVELDEPSWRDAVKNFSNSSWGGADGNIHLNAVLGALQQIPDHFPNKKYDFIVSNPPYFIDSLKSQQTARSNARHTDTLSQSELIRHALLLLKPAGVFSLILPAEEGDLFLQKIRFLQNAARDKEHTFVLHPRRLCKVRTTVKKVPKRYLMEFVFAKSTADILCSEEDLSLMENGDYTPRYKALTSAFYLNF